MKIQNLPEFYAQLPEKELLVLDVLRNLVLDILQDYGREGFSHSVPNFYGKKALFIIWPASVPRGGFKEGVFFGFWQGCYLEDKENYLTKGTNKRIFYKIYQSVEEIELEKLIPLIKKAIDFDKNLKI